MKKEVHVIGAGLAGSEIAFFLARHGVPVKLFEMRPSKLTEAHQTGGAAELVCSNSFKSMDPASSHGLLKNEMRCLGSLILWAAQKAQVPGGQALAVDRDILSQEVTKVLDEHPLITRVAQEVVEPVPEVPTVLATGPLTSTPLGEWLARHTGSDQLYFYDAIAPIVDADSLDRNKVFLANRYDRGEEKAYLNCPLTKEEYEAFIDALLAAEKVSPKNFEKENFFQGCQPIEAIAEKGRESLRFGPMKPVGLTDPRTGRWPYAAVQLRPENQGLSAYNLVGFQTKLKYGEQKKVFSLIPGLENADFFRLGSIHRNTYVCGPRVFEADLSLKGSPNVFLAGQITGVEGYLESAACGLMVAGFVLRRLQGQPVRTPPGNTALGSLHRYVTSSDPDHYQPTSIHFGLMEMEFFPEAMALPKKLRKSEGRKLITQKALASLQQWQGEFFPGLRREAGENQPLSFQLV